MPSLWSRILSLAGSGILALVLSVLAGGVWSVLLIANLRTTPALPWAVGVMAVLLGLFWLYLDGRWGPRRSAEARHRSLRAQPVSGAVFSWALAAGLLSIGALTGLWIVLFQLVEARGNTLPDFSRYPLLTVALVIPMASLVAAVAEEACVRGYFQGRLEREVGLLPALVIPALLMAPGHGLTQGFAWTTLLFYLLVDLMFGVTAYLTASILPGIAVHFLGILTFFTLVWPHDAARRRVAASGADGWFWLHAGQAVLFAALAVLAFRRLARVARTRGQTAAARAPGSAD